METSFPDHLTHFRTLQRELSYVMGETFRIYTVHGKATSISFFSTSLRMCLPLAWAVLTIATKQSHLRLTDACEMSS